MNARDPSTPPSRRFRARVTTLRRGALRRRRSLAALCAVGAVLAGLRAVAPPPPATVDVVVAARDLPAGTVLEAADLEHARLPPDAAPDALATSPEGAALAAPLRRGEPVTDVRLVGPDLTATDPDRVALPVRVSDADQVALLTAGDRIDLLATDPQARTTSTIAQDAVVLAVPGVPATGSGGLTGRIVVVGTDPAEVEDVTSAAVVAFVTYRWVSG